MKGRAKRPKIPGFMRAVLADNVQRLMLLHYAQNSNRPKALSVDAGVSLSTVQRILARDVGASLDNIEAMATAFDVSVYQLLIPELDTANPQVVLGASETERRLYRKWQQDRLGRAKNALITKT